MTIHGILNYLVLLRCEAFISLLLIAIIVFWLLAGHERTKQQFLLAVNILLFLNMTIVFLPVPNGSLFNEMFFADRMINFQKFILNLGAFLISLQAFDWLKKNKNVVEFYLLLLSTLLGMYLMISAKNFLMLYIGLELATLPLTALAAFEKTEKRSAEAGIKMILNSVLSSVIFIFGLSVLYGISGSMNYSVTGGVMNHSPLLSMAFIFIFCGFAFKISIVPFHLWTADVYEGAPVTVTAYLSVISKSAAVFVFLSLLYSVFEPISGFWQNILIFSSVVTMTVGNLFALRQNNLKRFLAFSSIAQAGYILLGIIGLSNLGYTSVVYFMLIYVFSNLGAFGVLSTIATRTGKENLDDFKGLYRTNPLLSVLLMVSMFSLAGVPPTAGFFGKFFLLASAAGDGHFILVLIAALNMILSLYYYLRIIKAVFIDKNENPVTYLRSNAFTQTGLLICFFGILFVGFFSFIFEFIKNLI